MSEVGFAGDWHGNTAWAEGAVRVFADLDISTVYHLGDFGLWPGRDGENYLTRLHRVCEQRDVTLFITLGNHEDYDRVATMQVDDDGWLGLPQFPLFRFAPRGHVWRHDGALFASLGGAGSIDLAHRVEGKSWWRDEAITDADVAELAANVAAAGGAPVDIMLTHDAPAGLLRPGMLPKPSWFTPEVEHYCWEGRVRLADAVAVARPRTLLHGHWHEWFDDSWATDGGSVKVWGLPDDGNWRNLIVGEPVPGVGLAEVKFAISEASRRG